MYPSLYLSLYPRILADGTAESMTLAIRAIDRKEAKEAILKRYAPRTIPDKSIHTMQYALTFVGAVPCVEHWMHRHAQDEVAMLIA